MVHKEFLAEYFYSAILRYDNNNFLPSNVSLFALPLPDPVLLCLYRSVPLPIHDLALAQMPKAIDQNQFHLPNDIHRSAGQGTPPHFLLYIFTNCIFISVLRKSRITHIQLEPLYFFTKCSRMFKIRPDSSMLSERQPYLQFRACPNQHFLYHRIHSDIPFHDTNPIVYHKTKKAPFIFLYPIATYHIFSLNLYL